ncbi:DUF2950 domain-containing protein [Qingshengfaniella alkalisoli]|nr:DUF2950 domain-containing protein [Qingshengfaniella alkalisoli]
MRVAVYLAGVMLACGVSQVSAQEYDTPEAALEALIDALDSEEPIDAAAAVVGEGSADLLSTGDPKLDDENRLLFVEMYGEGHRFEIDPSGPVVLHLGDEDWPFPIPLTRTDSGKWGFDVEAGRDEMALREIGGNELDVIDLMRAYVLLQAEYRLIDADGDGVMEFAGHILSSEGTRDGLFWPERDDSPVGDLVAQAAATGYTTEDGVQEPEPYLGYYYHILTEQGENAPGGAMSYVINGNQVAGHALLAYPAEYGVTGITSFMVSENGIVLEADLGEDTLSIANAIESFDPDGAWVPVADR